MANNIETYSGKSIAQQLLGDTKLGKWLWGNNTYKDGYGIERKDASFKESANGQLVERMAETAKDTGNLVATGFAFGNPLTAGSVMSPLITASQAYWIANGINDGQQRIENLVEDPNLKDAGMLALDVVSAVPVAKTISNGARTVINHANNMIRNYKTNSMINKAIDTGEFIDFGTFSYGDKYVQKQLGSTNYPLIGDGSEAFVFGPTKKHVLKVNGDMGETRIHDLLNSERIQEYISNRNALPTQVPIKFIGYTHSHSDNRYLPVFTQERMAKILPRNYPNFEGFINELNLKNGLSPNGIFKKNGIIYESGDFHPENIGIDKHGDYRYIDIDVYPTKFKKQGGKLKLQPGGTITPEHARLLGRRGMPGDKEALAAAGYDSKGRPLVTFGGGSFGAAGAGSTFGESVEQVDNHDYVRNTPILQSFSDAFNNARKSGLKSFTFNGKEYTTEMSDNPNYVGKRYQPLLNIREVLDKNMKVMSDSTRIEPYVGQLPGIIKRKSSQ